MTCRAVLTLIVLLVVLSATIAAGCIGGSTTTTTFTDSYPTDAFSETSSVDNSYSTSSGKDAPADAIKVYVIKVIDGDTIDITFPNGTTDRVRFLGVDTPETSASRNKPFCL